MKKPSVAVFILFLLLSILAGTQFNHFASANFMPPPPPPLPRIYIRANATLDPASAPIQVAGNVYTLTTSPGDVVIEVQRDNIVFDGAGYLLTGKSYENAIVLVGRTNVTVRNVVAQQFGSGIYLANSSNCIIEKNSLQNNQRGIQLVSGSRGNFFLANTFTNNSIGIIIYYCGGNVFRSNVMENNRVNLYVYVGYLDNHYTAIFAEFDNDIDASNTVNGKPVCYWINQHDRVVPAGSGYVALINCTGITVRNLTLTKNGQGILLFSAINCTVSQNKIVDNDDGVWADTTCQKNTISLNDFQNGGSGVFLDGAQSTVVVSNSIINASEYGIYVHNTRDDKVAGNMVRKSGCYAINLANNSGSVISQNTIADNNNPWDSGSGGICVGATTNDIIKDNIVANNKVGFYIHDVSKGNIFLNNSVTGNVNGLWFYYTTPYGFASNTFRSNRIDGNQYNLKFESSYIQDIDESNTINGKPINYWVNQHNKTVPFNAGFVGLVNCSHITVENLNVSGNWEGIMLLNTTECLVAKCNLCNNTGTGIHLERSSNNAFSQNKIVGNHMDGFFSEEGSNNTLIENLIAENGGNGIHLDNEENSSIRQNNITSNHASGIELFNTKSNVVSENWISQNQLGIHHYYSTQNTIIKNAIIESQGFGLRIEGSHSGSTVCQNNFINNNATSQNLQISSPWPCPPNKWDNCSQGNYWSDYKTRYTNASEINGTGIGDTSYFINQNNIDNYPLMKPIVIQNMLEESGSEYPPTKPANSPASSLETETSPSTQLTETTQQDNPLLTSTADHPKTDNTPKPNQQNKPLNTTMLTIFGVGTASAATMLALVASYSILKRARNRNNH